MLLKIISDPESDVLPAENLLLTENNRELFGKTEKARWTRQKQTGTCPSLNRKETDIDQAELNSCIT